MKRGSTRGNNADKQPKGQPPPSSRQRADDGLEEAAVPLDAEDIALERLQASLRRSEIIQAPKRRPTSVTRRTTVRLPSGLLARLQAQAQRNGVTTSEVVAQALERFLRPR